MPFRHRQHDPHAPMTTRAFIAHPATAVFIALIVITVLTHL